MTTPTLGMYLLPVQGFGIAYCLQVKAVIDCTDTHQPGMVQLQCQRWGIDDQRRPFDDGHHNMSYHTSRWRPVGRRAWRLVDEKSWRHNAVYFKQLDAQPRGQQDLFA